MDSFFSFFDPNLLGTSEEQTTDPMATAGYGLGGAYVAKKIADATAARQGFSLIGQPQTTSNLFRLGSGTLPQYTGATPTPKIVSGTSLVPTGQPPTITFGTSGTPTSASQVTKPANVTNVRTVNTTPQTRGTSGGFSKLASGLIKGFAWTPNVMGDATLTGANQMAMEAGEPLPFPQADALTQRLGYTPTVADAEIAPFRSLTGEDNNQQPTDGQQLSPNGGMDMTQAAIMGTLQETGQEKQGVPSGITPAPNVAEPVSLTATQAQLQEQFGAPTISAIQALPEGQGLGLRTDPQGRMIMPGADRSAYEQASAAREARLAERELQPGETQTERDTRIARERTQASQNIPRDVREAMNTPAGKRTENQIKRITDWQGSTQGSAYMAEQAAAEAEANKPFEPREVEIGGNKYIQLTPDYYQPVQKDTPEKTGLQSSLDNLRADFESGRLTQEEYDMAVGYAKDKYTGKSKDGFGSVIAETIAAGQTPSKNFSSIEEAEAANLPSGTKIIINGRPATVQ